MRRLYVLPIVCLLLLGACCCNEAARDGCVAPGEATVDQVALPPKPESRPAFEPEFYGKFSARASRRWMGYDEAIKVGLTPDEARFEGAWSYLTHGIDLHADRTFEYWSVLPDFDELEERKGTVIPPELRVISSGTWSAFDGKLRLEHQEIKGEKLPQWVVTVHTRSEISGSEDGLQDD